MDGLVLYRGRLERRRNLSILETTLLRAYRQVDATPDVWVSALFRQSGQVTLGAVVRDWAVGHIPPASDMRIMLPAMSMRESALHFFATSGIEAHPRGYLWLGPRDAAERALLALRLRSTADWGLMELWEPESLIVIRHPDCLPLRLTISFGEPWNFAWEETRCGETPQIGSVRGYRNMRLV